MIIQVELILINQHYILRSIEKEEERKREKERLNQSKKKEEKKIKMNKRT